MSNPLSTNDTFIEASVCILKEASDVQYNMSYFISNITCSDPTTCLGTKNDPFNSIIQALTQIHDVDLAGKFMSQNIALYLLGTPHYILNNEIPNGQSIRFFRRMNATIVISPWYCDLENLNGCFDRSQSERADIIFKTDLLYFEIYKNFTLMNLNVFGNDIVLSSSSGLSCYGTQSICCDNNAFNQSINNNECGLLNRTIDLAPKNSLSKIYGLFNLRLLYDEDFTSQADILETPTPILNLNNVSFNSFYSMISNNDGWLSLINFGTLGFIINLENVDFEACFFSYGFLYFSILEEDPYYSYLTSSQSQMSQLYLKYPLSNLYNSSIIMNGLTIVDYNTYSFIVSSGFAGTFASGMVTLFSGQINNTYYFFTNLMINNIVLENALYLLTFQANNSINIPSFIFENIQFSNNSLLLFAKINNSFLFLTNLLYNNSVNSANNNVLDFSESSSFSCIECYFFNSQFSQYFLKSIDSIIFFKDCLFQNISTLSMNMENGTISFIDSQIIDGSFANHFLEGINTLITLTNFSQIQNTDISFFLNDSSLSIADSQIIQSTLINFYFIEAYLNNGIITLSNVNFIETTDFSMKIRSASLILINTSVLNSNTQWTFIDHAGTNFSLINFNISNSTFSNYNQIISNSLNIFLQNLTLSDLVFPTVPNVFQFQNYVNLKMSSIYAYNLNHYYDASWTTRTFFSFVTNVPSFSQLNDIYLMNITYYYYNFINVNCNTLNFHMELVNLFINNEDGNPPIPFFVCIYLTNFYEIEILNSTLYNVQNLAFLGLYNSYQSLIFDNLTIKNCSQVNYKIVESIISDDLVPNSVTIFQNVHIENISLVTACYDFVAIMNLDSLILFNCSFINIHHIDHLCSTWGNSIIQGTDISNYSINFCTFDPHEPYYNFLQLSTTSDGEAIITNSIFIQSYENLDTITGCINLSGQLYISVVNNSFMGFFSDWSIISANRQYQNIWSVFQTTNSTFDLNNYETNGGIIFVSTYFLVNISNSWFTNCYGRFGLMELFYSSSIQLENIKFENNYSPIIAGLIFVSDCEVGVSISNVTSYNSSSPQQGGAFYIEKTQNLQMKNIYIVSSTSTLGGIFYISSCTNFTLENFISINSSANEGGAFYLDSVSLFLTNITISNSIATSLGGAFYISGLDSYIVLENATLQNCNAGQEGGVISLTNAQNLIFNNVLILFAQVDLQIGIGVVNLNSFMIESEVNQSDEPLFLFKNVIFLNNVGKPACIFYNSNIKIQIIDSIMSNATGTALSFESDSTGILEIFNFSISQCNSNKNGSISSNSLNSIFISFTNIVLNISKLSFIDNNNNVNFIEIENCTGTVMNSSFLDIFTQQNITSETYLFSISSSNLIFSDIEISYSDPMNLLKINFFYIVDNILISFINGAFSNALLSSSSVFDLENSVVSFNSCNFEKLGATLAVIYSTTTNLSFENSTFKSNQNQNLNSKNQIFVIDLYLEDQTVGVTNISIKNSTFQEENLGNSIYLSNIFNVLIDGSHFASSFNLNLQTGINFNVNTSASAIYVDDGTYIKLNSTTFNGFGSSQGGAISLFKLNSGNSTLTINISNCLFEANKGNFGGAIYMEGSVILNTFNSNFTKNIAQNISNLAAGSDVGGKGAALLSNCEYYPLCKVSVQNSTFIENMAENFGSTFLIKSVNMPDSNNDNIFINNTDDLNFTSAIGSLPLKLHLLDINYDTLIINNTSTQSDQINKLITTYDTTNLTIASGQTFNFILLFTDFYDQVLVFDIGSQGTLTCYTNRSYSEIVLLDKGKANSVGGILNFQDVLITHKPNFNLSCNITVVYDEDTIFVESIVNLLDSAQNTQVARNITISFDIYIRNCSSGEIYMQDETCRVCSQGFFSVTNPMINDAQCLSCPDNFVCLGGDQLYPLQGSWRYSTKSSIALTCPTEESCIGVPDDNEIISGDLIEGQCHPNYYGNLCYMCKTGYGRQEENANCQLCTQQVWVYLKIALGLIFLFFYIYLQAKVYTNLRSDDPNLAILLKLFLNHFQILAMVSVINFEWPVDFNSFFSMQEYFSCLYQDFFNIDCLVQQVNQDLLTQEIIFSILLPIILAMMMLLFWIVNFLLSLKKSKDENEKLTASSFVSSKMRVTFLSLIFILYPDILRKCFMLLNCLLIDDSTNYSVLLYSPNVECWGSEHTIWALTIALPGILVWGIITPLLILGALFRYRIQIKNFIQKEKEKAVEDLPKSKRILKDVQIFIEPAIKEKLFKDLQLPLTNHVIYKLENNTIVESFEISVKTYEEIGMISIPKVKENLNLLTIEPPNTTTNVLITTPNVKNEEAKEILEIPIFKNEAYFIKDPKILLSHLSFLEDIDENILKEADLLNNLVFFQVSFKEKRLEKKYTKRSSFFEKGKKKFHQTSTINEDDSLVFRNLGFIYKGYNEKYYFWEIILFSRKFLLIFIGVFTDFFPTSTRDMNLILIMMIYFLAQILCEPFHLKFLNNLETLSLLIATVTCYMGVLFYSNSMKKAALFFLIVIFSLNIFYLLLWLYYFRKFSNTEELYRRIMKKIRNRYDNLKEKYARIKEKIGDFWKKCYQKIGELRKRCCQKKTK